jgi:uncharacterized phage protein (TIGR01671 family)
VRTIKFRAWDTEQKLMFSNEEMHYKDEDNSVFALITDPEFNGGYYEFMQYTGLQDKNGKEIYESDLLKDEENFIWEVFYENGGFNVRCSDLMAEETLYETCRYDEVVGNIYSNPNLLEG